MYCIYMYICVDITPRIIPMLFTTTARAMF